MCKCTPTHTCEHAHACAHTHRPVNVHPHPHTCTPTCLQTCARACTLIHIPMNMFMCVLPPWVRSICALSLGCSLSLGDPAGAASIHPLQPARKEPLPGARPQDSVPVGGAEPQQKPRWSLLSQTLRPSGCRPFPTSHLSLHQGHKPVSPGCMGV